MSGGPSVASAVVVPDAEDMAPTPPLSAKRRNSNVSEESSKRPRISAADDSAANPPSKSLSKDLEERKRGKRLFGAVLGALNQSSSSTAQKRRGEIERKQREKLKQQEADYDKQEKQSREISLADRVKEQKLFDKQSLKLKHDNTIAMAYFLQTRSEPKLYYKPWELRPEEQKRIDEQVAAAKSLTAEEFETSVAAINADEPSGVDAHKDVQDAEGSITHSRDEPENRAGEGEGKIAEPSDANVQPGNVAGPKSTQERSTELAVETADEAQGDLVEGDEDDVMY